MPTRMTQEIQGTEGGQQQVLVRVLFDGSDGDGEVVEVAATVRVPAVESGDQTEVAARAMAKRAIEQALSAFPI